jgi:hypothetical protein
MVTEAKVKIATRTTVWENVNVKNDHFYLPAPNKDMREAMSHQRASIYQILTAGRGILSDETGVF